ncbi:peptidoglycan DD-metalloendopeptidase family protein [Leptospira interrogans]
MSRTQSSPRLTDLRSLISSRFVVLGLAVVAAGCSGGVTRFDSPMFGLTETGNKPLVPREGMRGNSTSSLAEAGAYNNNGYSSGGYSGGGYAAPSAAYEPVNVAALPDRDNRSAYAPSGSPSSGYQSPAYQPSYQAPYQPPQQPAYQSNYQEPPRSAPSYTPPSRSQSNEPAPLAWDSERSHRSPETARAPQDYTSRTPDRPRPQRNAGDGNSIEVQPGDTLHGIAQQNRVSISELMTLNGLTSPVLQPGQTLMLPGKPSATASAARGSARPQQRESRMASLPTQETEPAPLPKLGSFEAEKTAEPANVAPLHRASAPAPDAAAEELADGTPGTHTLKRGENLYGIAVRYRVPLAELQSVNNITDPRKLKPGMVLRLPGGGAEPKQAIASAASPIPERPAQPVVHAAVPAKPQAVSLQQEASGLPTQPVIINAQQPQQVAALTPTSPTATDATSAAAPAAQPAVASAPADATSKFRWPVRGKIIAGFGAAGANGTKSDGIKLAVPVGTEVHAAEGGVVAYAGDELKGYGNLVLVRHDNGWITAYAHNEELTVKRGDRVRRGQVIAKAGKSGSADTPQLHFELRQGSSPVDPVPHLEKL